MVIINIFIENIQMSTDTMTRSFSLPIEVVEFLDSLPSGKKSKFVSDHLSKAVEYQKKIRLAKELRDYPRVKGTSGESSTESLRRARKEASERLDRKI